MNQTTKTTKNVSTLIVLMTAKGFTQSSAKRKKGEFAANFHA